MTDAVATPRELDTEAHAAGAAPIEEEHEALVSRLMQGFWRFVLRFRFWIGGVLSFLLAFYIGIDPIPVQILRSRVFDVYQTYHPREYTPQPVVIVDIDEASLEAVGQWPWPRTIVAALAQAPFARGAVVVGFDVIFAEPDRTSPARVAEFVTGLKPETKEDLRNQPDNDAVLAQVMKQALVVLGQSGVDEIGEEEAERPLERMPIAYKGADPRPQMLDFPYLLRPIPALYDAAAGHGMVTLKAELDGIVRRVPAVTRVGEYIYAALPVEMLRVATGKNALLIKTGDVGIEGVAVGKSLIPTDASGRMYLHYTPKDDRRYVSAKSIFTGEAAKDAVAGKLVLIGSSATALGDIKAIPLGINMPGVEIQAQTLESILGGFFLQRPSYAIGAEALGTFFVCALILVLSYFVGARWTLLVFAVLLAGLFETSWYLFTEHSMLFDITYAAMAMFLIYLFITYLSFASTDAERQEVRNAFGRYLSPTLVEQLADDPSRLRLGGESRELTLLFCDIQGFTTISEMLDAQSLTRLINGFFTPMTDAILRWRGTVDKYMGDCVMAFWNAPLDNPEHRRDASFAALEMMQKLEGVNDTLRAQSERDGTPFYALGAGIGLNAGICMVGNMGSDQRFDYSALGDPVNLASRLEGQTRSYGVPIVIGESVYKDVTDLATLELDLIQVKGKREPARIYALLGDQEMAQEPEFEALESAHEAMLSAYRAQNWDESEGALVRCREHAGKYDLEGLYKLFDERIGDYRNESPGADWDGVFVAVKK